MKKNLWISAICLVLLMFVLNSCGGGKYSDVISLNHQFGKLMEQYANDIDKAGNAKDVAKAMNRFSDSAEKLVPKMKKISDRKIKQEMFHKVLSDVYFDGRKAAELRLSRERKKTTK